MNKELFLRTCAAFGVTPDARAVERFLIYAAFLREYNEKVNLTAITDPDGIAVKHFADSVIPFAGMEKGLSVIDVGTGAGFPSVPWKIMDPTLKLTLLDSLNKRIVFLHQLCEKLGFDDVTFVHARAEEAAQKPQFREKFDVATARAVAALPELTEYCLPFVKVGGRFVALKGFDCEDEVARAAHALELLGGKIGEVRKLKLDETAERSVIMIQKISHTPTKYPRPSAKMAKQPL